MRHLALATAAALLVATSFAQAQSQPQSPDRAGPIQVNGQCKQRVDNSHEGTFYTWGACPKPAAAAVVHRTARRHRG